MDNVSPQANVHRPVRDAECRRDNVRRCSDASVAVCTWNVEGLTEVKLHEIQQYMERNNILICGIQETRRGKSDYYYDNGHLVVLSGRNDSEKEWAGVGFVVASKLAKHVVGFCQISSRVLSLRLRMTGGIVAFICVYAPHNLKDMNEKLAFYEDLDGCYKSTSTNGPKIVLGDFNAKIGQRRAGEEDVLGEFCFGIEAVHRVDIPN